MCGSARIYASLPKAFASDDVVSPGMPGGGDFAAYSIQHMENQTMLKKLGTMFAVAGLLLSFAALPTFAQDKDKKGAKMASKDKMAAPAADAAAAPKKAKRHAKKAKAADAAAAGSMEKKKP